MAEISDAELAVKNRAVDLLNRMISDPTDGLAVKRKIKALVPDANFPELNVIDVTTAPIKAALDEQSALNKKLTDRLDKWESDNLNAKEESALQAQLDSIKKQYSFTTDGMQKVVDRMKAKNNPDAESAAAWVAAQERKAQPVAHSGLMPAALNLYGSNTADESWEALNRDPQKWMDNELVTMMNEFAAQDAA